MELNLQDKAVRLTMRYIEFRDSIRTHLKGRPGGRTWKQLKTELRLPYTRPCPSWVGRLEAEIGLRRVKGDGRELIWKIP